MTTYVDMGDKVYEEIEEAIRTTYENSCICWIEKINNPELEEKFVAYASSITDPNIKRLFHGTSEDISRKIAYEGFDPARAKVCAHGMGVYFSTRAQYSKAYAKKSDRDGMAFMMVCDVVCGNVGQGRSYTHFGPPYHSVTDNIKNPDMYIVNRHEAAIPRYIVAFYPNAK